TRVLGSLLVGVLLLATGSAHGQKASDATPAVDLRAPYAFAVGGAATGAVDQGVDPWLHAIGEGGFAFAVFFDQATPSPESCSEARLQKVRETLDTSAKPIVPVI